LAAEPGTECAWFGRKSQGLFFLLRKPGAICTEFTRNFISFFKLAAGRLRRGCAQKKNEKVSPVRSAELILELCSFIQWRCHWMKPQA
jgi:hypothetical protein